MNNQIFKLFFHHDLRLNDLDGNSSSNSDSFSVEDFMKPDLTYSRLYFSGTDLDNNTFGLSTLKAFDEIISALNTGFGEATYITEGNLFSSFSEALQSIEIGKAIVISTEIDPSEVSSLSNNDRIEYAVKSLLERNSIIIFKEAAEHGFNLTMLSMANIYRNFFHPLQQLLPDSFRFFSINAKRVRSEKDLVFDIWTLHRPPHGFEEVFPESVL